MNTRFENTCYSDLQITGAKMLFELHNICDEQKVTDSQAIAFLDYWFSSKSKYNPTSLAETPAYYLLHGKSITEDQIAKMKEIRQQLQ